VVYATILGGMLNAENEDLVPGDRLSRTWKPLTNAVMVVSPALQWVLSGAT